MDKFFWPDFVSGIYFAIATLIFLFVYFFLVIFICNKFKWDDIWGTLVGCILFPFFAILAFPLFPNVRSLGTPTPTVIHGSRGATVMPDLSTIPIGSILGISITIIAVALLFYAILRVMGK